MLTRSHNAMLDMRYQPRHGFIVGDAMLMAGSRK
jgi:hypothetical protein